jgi:hypothetical protein
MDMTVIPKRGNIDKTQTQPVKEWNGLDRPNFDGLA